MIRLETWRGPAHVIDIQADLLSHLESRAVVPLIPEKRGVKFGRKSKLTSD